MQPGPRRAIVLLVLLTANCAWAAPAAIIAPIHWQRWSDEAFASAKRDHKLVILDLEAVWCHWCHVQDATTYADPAVRKLIADNFIAIKVDQDSRPDISARYENYGWPATILFDSDGHEIVKRRGYIPPEAMASMLKATIADPTPGPSIQPEAEIHPATQPFMFASQRNELAARLKSFYDEKNGGWGVITKFVDADVIEYSTLLAQQGDKHAERQVRATLTAGLKLIDPVWGGVYQYSTDGDWDHPHFEKIMSYQADDLRTYAHAHVIFHDPAYLAAAQAIHHFLQIFLTDKDGAFYASMDADPTPGEHGGEYFKLADTARRAQGLPRVDTHIYSRENGWAIAALVSMSQDTGDAGALVEAQRAAKWIIIHRALDNGGFLHGDADPAGPYLADTLAMGRAFLALYSATGNRDWLARADSAGLFIESHFVTGTSPGVLTAAKQDGRIFAPQADVDEMSLSSVSLDRSSKTQVTPHIKRSPAPR